jgi:poly-gamma-glutamate capsule biosynthesis protein CapA/YwtB (metallophosphatase superfamily)
MAIEQQQLIKLAKQGQPEAIAQLINRNLAPHKIQATVTRQNHQLSILLLGEQLPAAQIYGKAIYKGFQHLSIPAINQVSVAGQQIGQPAPAWKQTFSIQSAQPAAAGIPKQLSFFLPITLASFVLGIGSGAFWVAGSRSTLTTPAIAPPSAQLPITQPDASSFPPQPPTTQELAQVTTPIYEPSVLPPAATPLPPSPTQPEPRSLTIKAVGDIILGTNFPNNRLPPNQGKTLFQQVIPYLKGADILFGNYESTFTTYPTSAKTMRPGSLIFAFRSPPAYAARLKEAGFQVLNVANNHSFDFHERGFDDTMRAINAIGMQAVGRKNQILYHQVEGRTVAFIGFSYLSYHNTVNDLTTAKALVRRAEKEADIVVVSHHSGAEGSDEIRTRNQREMFLGENRGNPIAFSRAVVDAGADLVLGHGPHVPRAIELYKGRLIAYSLGNFVGYRTLSTVGNLGKSLILEVKLNSQGSFLTGNIIPVQLNGAGIPAYDPRFRSVQLIRQLTKLDFPKTALVINSKGQINPISIASPKPKQAP